MVTDPEDAVDAAAREWEEMQRLDQLDGGLDDVGAHSKQPDKGKQPRSENAPATDELEAMRELEEEGAGGGNDFFVSRTALPNPTKPAIFESSQDDEDHQVQDLNQAELELARLKKEAKNAERQLNNFGRSGISSSPQPIHSSPSDSILRATTEASNPASGPASDNSDSSGAEPSDEPTSKRKLSALTNFSYLDTILHPEKVAAALEQADDEMSDNEDTSGPSRVSLQLEDSLDDSVRIELQPSSVVRDQDDSWMDELEQVATQGRTRRGELDDDDDEEEREEDFRRPEPPAWDDDYDEPRPEDDPALDDNEEQADQPAAGGGAAVDEDDWMAELDQMAGGRGSKPKPKAKANMDRGAKRTAADLSDVDEPIYGDAQAALSSKSARRRLFSDNDNKNNNNNQGSFDEDYYDSQYLSPEAQALVEQQERQQVLDDLRRARRSVKEAEEALHTHLFSKRNWTLPVDGPCLRARTSGLETEVYFPFRTLQPSLDAVSELRGNNDEGSLLQGTTIYRILDELDAEKAQAQQNNHGQVESQLVEIGMTANDARQLAMEVEHGVTSSTTSVQGKLWTDKYRPKRYTDLIGDETVNRSVLSWVKAWDYCVFNKKHKASGNVVPAHEVAARGNFRGRGRGGGQRGGFQGRNGSGQQGAPKDRWQRPENRILLIGGPPGLGKTTLAHVVARHCGYDVIEINASDERAASTLTQRVESATQNRSLIGTTITSGSRSKTDSSGKGKPTLIVLDEIDGVSQAEGQQGNFIQVLVEMATASADGPGGAGGDDEDEEKKDGEDDESGAAAALSKKKAKKGKKSAKYPPLRRPIICVCNDPYAPALRNLRNVALVINIRVPPVKALAKRLEDICSWEGLSVELRTLMALVEETQGDIRSCLMTLQFVRSKTDRLTFSDLQTLSVGRKDTEKSMFTIWDAVFQLPSAKQERAIVFGTRDRDTGQELSGQAQHMATLLNMVSSHGEYDRLLQGCFETYIKQRHVDTSTDPAKTRINMLLDYLTDFHDVISGRVGLMSNWELQGYMPYVFVAFHRFFATTNRTRAEWPRKDYEAYMATKTNENILQLMQKGLAPKAKPTWNLRNTALELVSPLLRIMSPELRPVSVQLMKPEEKKTLKRLINIMVTFGLDFKQEKVGPEDRSTQAGHISTDGSWVFRLEPPIQHLIEFSTDTTPLTSRGIIPYGYTVRQTLAHELEFERVRRAEKARSEREKELEELGKRQGGEARAAAGALFSEARKGEAELEAGKAAAALEEEEANKKELAEREAEAKQKREEDERQRKQALKDRVLEKIAARKPSEAVVAKVALDFFGRPLIKESVFDNDDEEENEDGGAGKQARKVKTTDGAKVLFKVVYKFNEGFSNAVRTPLYMRDFL